jgi:hypothetical protein
MKPNGTRSRPRLLYSVEQIELVQNNEMHLSDYEQRRNVQDTHYCIFSCPNVIINVIVKICPSMLGYDCDGFK